MAENQTQVNTSEQLPSNAKLFSILAYISLLWLLGLLISPEKTSPFVRSHVNNGIVLCITGADKANMDRYEKEFLFSSSEVEHTVCSLKQTTYMASMIGSIITNLFTNFVADTLKPDFPYSLPFFTAYDAENMVFITEE